MLPRPNASGIPDRERRRIERELDKIRGLADAGVRGTSSGSVARYALNRVGGQARKALRQGTPKRTGRLRRSVRGRVDRGRGGQLWYRAGYARKLLDRFQQALAIEWGARGTRPVRAIRRALDTAAGRDGGKFRSLFVDEMQRRIRQLALKANAGARR